VKEQSEVVCAGLKGWRYRTRKVEASEPNKQADKSCQMSRQKKRALLCCLGARHLMGVHHKHRPGLIWRKMVIFAFNTLKLLCSAASEGRRGLHRDVPCKSHRQLWDRTPLAARCCGDTWDVSRKNGKKRRSSLHLVQRPPEARRCPQSGPAPRRQARR
jgi:hypothetical protein